jgi:dephospho-CoA kinase
MVFAVGLTGGIGSGKTTVAEMFVALGAGLVDTDAIAHRLTAPAGAALTMIEAKFGKAFLSPDGGLNRAAMRQKVFSDADAKQALEAILHPMIRGQVDAEVASCKTAYVIVAIPLLVESGNYRDRVDRVLVVDCPEEAQLARTMKRSSFSMEQVTAIMLTQVPRRERIKHADDILLNNGDRDALIHAVAVLDRRFSRLAEISRNLSCAQS